MLKQLSGLVSRMIDPMASALEEIQRSRLSRAITLAVFGFVIIVVLSVQTHILLEHQKLVEKVEAAIHRNGR